VGYFSSSEQILTNIAQHGITLKTRSQGGDRGFESRMRYQKDSRSGCKSPGLLFIPLPVITIILTIFNAFENLTPNTPILPGVIAAMGHLKDKRKFVFSAGAFLCLWIWYEVGAEREPALRSTGFTFDWLHPF
jgi:hypothetical protein